MAVVAPLYPLPRRPVFFAAFFTDFWAAFLAATFLTVFFAAFLAGAFLATAFVATFFAGVFFAAFFGTVFFIAFLAGAFVAALLAGDFFDAPVTVVAAAPIAVLMPPATSDAISIPIPTISPAVSTIVLSAILRPLSLCVHTQLRIVDAYRSKCRGLED